MGRAPGGTGGSGLVSPGTPNWKIDGIRGDPHSHRAEDVKEVVSSQRSFTVFEMLRYLGRHETHKALTSLRACSSSGEAPLGILGMLARQVRILWRIKAGIEQGWSTEDLVKKLKLSPYLVKNLSREATRFSEADLGKSTRRCGRRTWP